MNGLPPSLPHAFGLDALRAIAVSCVLLAHGALFYAEAAPNARYVLIVCGVAGVEIFFALSGFLVGRQLLLVATGEASAWHFVLRRWWRTLPNYFLFLAINALLVWFVIDRQGPDARFLVFAQALAWPATSAFFPESWSLAVEEWFYGLAALAFALAASRRATARALGWGLLALVLVEPVARFVAQCVAPIAMDAGVRKISVLRLDALAFGVGAAWLERHAPATFATLARPFVIAAGFALALAGIGWLAWEARDLAFFEPARTAAERVVASFAFSAFPLAAALMIPWLARTHATPGLVTLVVQKLAAWSYSIYLAHFPLLLVMLAHWAVATPLEITLRTATWLAATLVLAATVHRFWEMPLMARRPPLAKTREGLTN